MKKVLFIATVVQKHINVFHLPFLKNFQENGYETYVAAANDTNDSNVSVPYCDHYVEIKFKRNPFHPGNLLAYIKLKKLIDNNAFDIIHCHTPVGGMLGRLASRSARKKGTKVFYTAHGFHFYKGAKKINWLLYYPVEKFCSYLTDVLITINNEDFTLAKKKMKAKRIEYVPGVGIDLTKFNNVQVDRNVKRQELGVPRDAFLITSVGEISKRKNHRIIIDALRFINDDRVHYVIVGTGPLLLELKSFAENIGVNDRVHFIGYRNDVSEIYAVSDIACLPSIHEGLPVALIEAMASGLPCVASRIRGCTDLISEESGFLINPNDVNGIIKAISDLLNDQDLRRKIGNDNKERAHQYSVIRIVEMMKSIYESEVR